MTLVIKKRAEGWLIYKVRKSGRTLPVPERLRPTRGLWCKEMKTERQTAYGNPFWPDFIAFPPDVQPSRFVWCKRPCGTSYKTRRFESLKRSNALGSILFAFISVTYGFSDTGYLAPGAIA